MGCDEAERHRYRRQRQDSSTPEFSEWKPWAGEIGCGHFWSEDLRSVRAQLLAAGHQPKVALRGLCEWSALRLRASGGDCVIRELCEDAQVLQEWTQRLGVPYRGQRLAGASLEVFLHLLQRRRDNTSSRRAALLAEQDGMCKLCGAAARPSLRRPASWTTSFRCARPTRDSPWSSRPCASNATKSRPVWRGITAPPWRAASAATSTRTTPPALGCRPWSASCRNGTPSAPARASTCRCRKNGLANARFPIPVFCPLDCIVPAREGELADLTYVDLPFDGRRGLLDRLPYVGRGWYSKPACAEMLDSGLAQWRHFRWSLEATAHVDQRWLEQALQTMEEACLDLVYSMRTSNHQVDGEGCSWRQTFTDAAGRMHWDHVFVTELLSNSSYRPVHDFIMGAEYSAVARVRRALAEVPKRYLKCLKTDCLVMQDVPKKNRSAIERLLRLSHRDGTPVYRCEPTEGLRGQCREPRMEAEPIKEKPAWPRVEDPLTHCLGGESLLLTGYPGTGKTHLARKIVEALRELGDTVHIITKTHAAVQNVGLGAQTADHWVRRNVRSGRCSATWLVIEELTQLDTPLWADIACLSMNTSMRFLLLGDFCQLPAVLDSFAGAEVCRELKDSQLLHDLAGGWCHELSERWRFDEGVFSFLQWLRVDEAEQVPLREAVQMARQRFPRRGEPEVCLVISHAKRLQINERENRRRAPEDALLVQYAGPETAGTNAPQTMRVWPGLRLVGAGGKVQKGVFVTVSEVGERVALESGQSFEPRELLKHTRLCSAITYASVQGLTLRGRVWLCDVDSPHFTMKHLYMGCSRATSSELLSVL